LTVLRVIFGDWFRHTLSASLYTFAIAPEHSNADTYLDTVAGAVGSFVQNRLDWCGASIPYSLPALVFQETCTYSYYLIFTLSLGVLRKIYA